MQNKNNASYQPPILIADAQVEPRLISASETLDWFGLAEPLEILGVLSTLKYLKTAFAGSNNDLVFFAVKSGDQAITMKFTDPGGVSSSFAVEVVDADIEVTLARAASAITTTAAQAIAGIRASAEASALITVEVADGNDGTGVVAALAQTPLAGPAGTSPTLDVELENADYSKQEFSINAAFGQKTAAENAEAGIFATPGEFGRWKISIGGTGSPEFAFRITTTYKPGRS